MNESGKVKNIGHYFEKVLDLAPTDQELSDIYEREFPHLYRVVDNFIKDNELEEVEIADFGGGNGAVIHHLKENSEFSDRFRVTCIDSNQELLDDNTTADVKILSDLTQYDGEELFDIVIMRYVLQFNNKGEQFKILENIHRALKNDGIFLNWHVSVENEDHKERFLTLLASDEINPKLNRPNSYWDTMEDIFALKVEAGFDTEIVDFYSSVLHTTLKLKYNLSDEEDREIQEFLGEYNYINCALTVSKKLSEL